MSDIKLSTGVVVKDTHKAAFFSRLSWAELREYAWRRLGWTKETFIYYLLKNRETEIQLQQKLYDYE